MRKKCFILMLFIVLVIALSACSSSYKAPGDSSNPNADPSDNKGEYYKKVVEMPFLDTQKYPNSAFSMAVNTAGYSTLRSNIKEGNPITADMVKIEEIVNYFKYSYPTPEEGKSVSLTASMFSCPWNANNNLLTVGVKAKEIQQTEEINNNIVFLIDVSGSMNTPDKIGLAQISMIKLLQNLNHRDKISIVTYSGIEEVLLNGGNGSEQDRISDIIMSLTASGSTFGEAGIQTAYSIAQEHFIEGGNNRVVLATDGDFNVGISDENELKEFISGKRDTGVYLTVLGFGKGNLQDAKMEALANSGNGNYAYIDSIAEADKVMVKNFASTLHIVARDAKINVEFNPAKVSSYRLIGYENSILNQDEYANSQTDAGEIGSGYTVTAVYEVVLANNADVTSTMDENFLKVELKYKNPDTSDDTQLSVSTYVDASDINETPTEDQLFISALVETCLILRNSKYKGNSNINNVKTRLTALPSVIINEYRAEFLTLVDKLITYYNYNSIE